MQRRTFLRAGVALAIGLGAPGVGATTTSLSASKRSLEPGRMGVLRNLNRRLRALERLVGYANFNLLGFARARRLAGNYPQVGPFMPEEVAFVEQLFATDARLYGFHGERLFTHVDAEIDTGAVVKVAGSGHYLFAGAPLNIYRRLRRELGGELILTSGVRGLVKQLALFVRQAVACQGDFAQVAGALAPPGYSYHGVADFDVGKAGWGRRNFSTDFAETHLYQRLRQLEYVQIRYPQDNPFGVRFEPWHCTVLL